MAETTAVEGRLKLRGAEEVSVTNNAEEHSIDCIREIDRPPRRLRLSSSDATLTCIGETNSACGRK